ncbi:hypothetical protein GNI_094050, partial [Gregarina niphandrodes]
MNADGMQPPIRGCQVMLLSLTDRTEEAKVQFVVAAQKEAMKKLIEAVERGGFSKKSALLDEEKRFDWFEQCSRIFMWTPRGESNTMGETLAMRDLKDYLEFVDPGDEFSHVSDQVCRESVNRKMSEVRKALKK